MSAASGDGDGTTRGSSLSPKSWSEKSSARGSPRPAPPVRPKPKRTVTVPIMITTKSAKSENGGYDDGGGRRSNGDNASKLESSSTTNGGDDKKKMVPSKGTVKSLAERFEVVVPRTQTSMTESVYIGKSSSRSIGSKATTPDAVDTKLKRQSVSAVICSSSGTNLRFPKPAPPAHRAHRHTLLSDSNSSSSIQEGIGHHTAISSSCKGRSAGDNADLSRTGREEDATSQHNSEHDDVANGQKKEIVSSKRSHSCEGAKNSTPRNSMEEEVDPSAISLISCVERPYYNSSDTLTRRGSQDAAAEPDVPAARMNKKIPPPAVPPKPAKKLSNADSSDYAEYDVFSSVSPYSVFSPPPPSASVLEEEDRKNDDKSRIRLPPFRNYPSVSDSPSAECFQQTLPERYSLRSPPSSETMELVNESQLNISGHIYCAVRHGEVVEDEYDVPNIPQVAAAAENNKGVHESEEMSFSAAVFGAIEALATNNDEGVLRVIDEDAMTNYEEIFEDALELVANENENGIVKSSETGLLSASAACDPNGKWESSSNVTSTSADSTSSPNAAPAPTLIGFRRRSSSQERTVETQVLVESPSNGGAVQSAAVVVEDKSVIATAAAAVAAQQQQQHKKRETKPAHRSSAARLSRHSQMDAAAPSSSSLWRIKSDIQLNLSQAMGKIRLKVSSAASATTPTAGSTNGTPGRNGFGGDSAAASSSSSSKRLEQKARSTFYLPTGTNAAETTSTTVSHPASISITVEAGLADEMASSAAPSSSDDDEDDEDDEDEKEEAAWGCRARGQLDDVTPTGFAANLPDLVPHASITQTGMASKSLLPQEDVRPMDGLSTTDSSGPSGSDGDMAMATTAAACSSSGLQVRPSLVSESSCSTVASGIGELERFEPIYNSRFAFSEPLYQHYRDQTNNGNTSVQRNQTFSEGDGRGTISKRDKLLSASQLGSQRTLWCELPEVRGAGLLDGMTDEARKLQEAMFEVITSEASYLRSLNILITQFMASPKLSGNTALGSCVTKQERKQLFSNILAVRDCSERFLCSLESRLEESVVLEDVCDLLHEHLRLSCDTYVKYCSNQIYQERTLNELRLGNAEFCQAVTKLEEQRVCECLNLRSFLMLPMQRVTRYPLLIAAVLHRTEEGSNQRVTAQRAYGTAGRVVRQCNEGAKRLERIEQLIEVDQMLVYREGGPKRVALVSGSRWLIKKGVVCHLFQRQHTLGVRSCLRQRKINLFLLTDMLLITKPVEGDKKFVIKDYCQRQFVEVAPLEPSCPQIPEGSNLPPDCHLILCTLMNNHRGRQVQFIIKCDTETDKTRWLEAIRPPNAQEDGDERIYEPWDCPQVQVVKEYHAAQEDELQLEVGEVINVLRKMPDGWYEGERTRDGEKGWFPGSVTEEILSDHIRAKNYRDRLRLLNEAELLQRNYVTDNRGVQRRENV